MIYPDEITPLALSSIKEARSRIDNLMEMLHNNDRHLDVAIGVLPLDKEEMIKYKRSIDI